jgi:hypothetical protein
VSVETIESAAADAALLDLMMNDAALGALTRVSPGGTGLRLAAALAARPRRSSHPSGTGGSPPERGGNGGAVRCKRAERALLSSLAS